MLRANILQPLTDIKIINSRFDLVEILLDKNNKGILEMLTK
jgi:DNA mismatch repair ATPase MutS